MRDRGRASGAAGSEALQKRAATFSDARRGETYPRVDLLERGIGEAAESAIALQVGPDLCPDESRPAFGVDVPKRASAMALTRDCIARDHCVDVAARDRFIDEVGWVSPCVRRHDLKMRSGPLASRIADDLVPALAQPDPYRTTTAADANGDEAPSWRPNHRRRSTPAHCWGSSFLDHRCPHPPGPMP